MNKKRRLILDFLNDYHPEGLYATEMVRKSGGKLRRGSNYSYLSRMKEDGLVTSRKYDNRGFPRTKFFITEAGMDKLKSLK